MTAPVPSSGLSPERLEEIEKAVTFITHEMVTGLRDAHDCGDDDEAEEYACAIDAVSDLLAEVRRLQTENFAMHAALDAAREETAQAEQLLREMDLLYPDIAQLFDGWHFDQLWSEWDETVRRRLSAWGRARLAMQSASRSLPGETADA